MRRDDAWRRRRTTQQWARNTKSIGDSGCLFDERDPSRFLADPRRDEHGGGHNHVCQSTTHLIKSETMSSNEECVISHLEQAICGATTTTSIGRVEKGAGNGNASPNPNDDSKGKTHASALMARDCGVQSSTTRSQRRHFVVMSQLKCTFAPYVAALRTILHCCTARSATTTLSVCPAPPRPRTRKSTRS